MEWWNEQDKSFCHLLNIQWFTFSQYFKNDNALSKTLWEGSGVIIINVGYFPLPLWGLLPSFTALLCAPENWSLKT